MNEPTPPVPPPEPKVSHGRGIVNQALLEELTEAEAILKAAAPADRAAKLAEGGIDAGKIAALTAAIPAARTLASQAAQGTRGKQGVTANESVLQDDLINKIQEVQKRARQKYAATDPSQLPGYAIGQPFYSSRSVLEQTGANLLRKLNGDPAAVPPVPADVLPGITPAKIAALQTALADYQDVQGDQTGAQSSATTARRQLEAAVSGIMAERREIQFAADAEWPHTDPANAGIRVEFQLPVDRVMK
jgi:hypothetical protein